MHHERDLPHLDGDRYPWDADGSRAMGRPERRWWVILMRLAGATSDRSPVAVRRVHWDADAADRPATRTAAEWRWRAAAAVATASAVACRGCRRHSGCPVQTSAASAAPDVEPVLPEVPAVPAVPVVSVALMLGAEQQAALDEAELATKPPSAWPARTEAARVAAVGPAAVLPGAAAALPGAAPSGGQQASAAPALALDAGLAALEWHPPLRPAQPELAV